MTLTSPETHHGQSLAGHHGIGLTTIPENRLDARTLTKPQNSGLTKTLPSTAFNRQCGT